jgi:hypothetical protein
MHNAYSTRRHSSDPRPANERFADDRWVRDRNGLRNVRENAGSIDEGYWRTAGQAYDSFYGSAFEQESPQRSSYARVGMSPSLSNDDGTRVGSPYMSGQFLGSGAVMYRGKGPKGYTRSDERLHEMICDALSDAPHIDASEINVTVKNAEVTLTGSVDSRRTKHAVEDLVERRTGASEIHNKLRVQARDSIGADQSQADAWLRN